MDNICDKIKNFKKSDGIKQLKEKYHGITERLLCWGGMFGGQDIWESLRTGNVLKIRLRYMVI